MLSRITCGCLAVPDCPARNAAIQKANGALNKLRKRQTSLDTLLGLEGLVANAYFLAWRNLPVRRRATNRHPIPDNWRTYRSRPALAGGRKPLKRSASHPINAMLNYAYAVLESGVRIKAIAEGYDPTLGVVHRSLYGSAAFVFDLMEPLRPVEDAAVLGFVRDLTFSGADFVLRADGVCRLSLQLARTVVQGVSGATEVEHGASWK